MIGTGNAPPVQIPLGQIGRGVGATITKSHNFILPPGQDEAVAIDMNKGYLVGAHNIGRANGVKTCWVRENVLVGQFVLGER